MSNFNKHHETQSVVEFKTAEDTLWYLIECQELTNQMLLEEYDPEHLREIAFQFNVMQAAMVKCIHENSDAMMLLDWPGTTPSSRNPTQPSLKQPDTLSAIPVLATVCMMKGKDVFYKNLAIIKSGKAPSSADFRLTHENVFDSMFRPMSCLKKVIAADTQVKITADNNERIARGEPFMDKREKYMRGMYGVFPKTVTKSMSQKIPKDPLTAMQWLVSTANMFERATNTAVRAWLEEH